MMMVFMTMAAVPSVSVYADRESDLREEQVWTSAQLDSAYAQIDSLYAQKQQLQNEINELDSTLVSVMVSIQTMENDINNKASDIEVVKANMEKAEKAKNKQYEAMKKRIQYIYENGGNDAWLMMIAESENLSDLINRADYTQKLYDYDRENLEKYTKTVVEFNKLKETYEQEKAELESMKQEYEAESANLQAAIDQRRAVSADCDNEIAYAQQMANEYAALLQQQQAEIEHLVAERIAAEQAAAEEAARIAEEERRAAEEAEYEMECSEEYTDDDGYDYEERDDEEDYSENDADYEENESCEKNEAAGDSGYESTTSTAVSGYGSSGSSVVDYATQFVGNPYVWGGTSLTNGADCSGFVQSVYSNFGVSLPRTSYEQQNAGTEVSYSDAQPGDLICYGGHVAIYMGDGKIVHASNSRDGIKVSDNAAYRTIVSVRRLV